ncbi:TetR/AcrR family transcriptional regulator [Litoreibacter roseus]|uniref:HTH tetR-type domain-containing protein n=1 Tax=Litoreibacter roseus TaxID=2601869 RepID=A0A6N6JNJ5_9RHOB|nr:TetR/AcrR family transcriptional regulator [Litoreibacter roseus]GFE66922.1 hypothetical protein KIN_39960 [Litoreibacter roseus]
MAKANETRTRLLDIAADAVLAKGFEATSIDEIVAGAHITKSGFFYHFPDKNALALALLQRYIDAEDQLFDDIFGRARELTDDPLQAMLVGLKMLAEVLEDIPNGHPGCLVAAAAYNERAFNRDVRKLNENAMLRWRFFFRKMFDDVAAFSPPRDPVNLDDLADMLLAVVEGGIVLSKSLSDPEATGRQVRMFRSYVKLLFQPQAH